MKMRISLLAFLIAALLTLLCLRFCSVFAEAGNGFDLSNASIPAEQILQGGPPKDGIPSIDEPMFERGAKSTWLKDEQQVLSLTINGVTKAYPIAILNWHEIVNDTIAGTGVVISYCPLCGTGVGFLAEADGRSLKFGVSGLLYNSDVLLYDRQTQSLWSQLKNRAISGPMEGEQLTMLPLEQMTWVDWKATYKDGLLLTRDTGHPRDYSRSPYGSYDQSPSLYFPVEFLSRAYHPKERVLGIEVNGLFKAYPFAELAKVGGEKLMDRFNGADLMISFNAQSRTGKIERLKPGKGTSTDDTNIKGAENKSASEEDSIIFQPAVNAFWFAWYTFHPETDVYKAP